VEIDVQASADGTLWLFHDPGLKRLTGARGEIARTTDTELAKLRLLAPEGGDSEPLARLTDFARWLAAAPAELFAFVEVKPEVVDQLGADATLRKVLDDLGDTTGRCAVISFALPLLASVRARCKLPIAPILEHWDDHQDAALLALDPEWVFVNKRHVPSGALPQAGWGWIVYETVDPQEARDLLQRGAQLVETFDYPVMSPLVEQPSRGRVVDED